MVNEGGNPINALSLLEKRHLGILAPHVDPGALDDIVVVASCFTATPADGTSPSDGIALEEALHNVVYDSVHAEQA